MLPTLMPPTAEPPANVVRCVACDGPIRHIERKPYECAHCSRNLYQHDGLIRPGYHWEITDAGWLISVETVDDEDDDYDETEEEFLGW
ncbi:hypothetical protein [Streptomyces cinnamoneus]|uniref:hypothetical protein n=1 Tax=Streptomyces cinnamoneus TaxID=53446 RepID=UPI000D4651FE|nr:hypothetical protein [Streptomyces cinnamoneus]PPT14830.1 hypothetical protein CYQ11_19910 [Streptomyces cinnamoneus]